MSIIDEILGFNPNNNDGMSAADMYIENNPHGYLSKSVIRPFLTTIGKNNAHDLRMLETAFDNLKEGTKIVNLFYKQDDNGQDVTWLKMKVGSIKLPIKVCLTERLLDFFKDYQKELIKPTFNLAELLAEAEK